MVIPKGYAPYLEGIKLSTNISAQELEWWIRQWDTFKNVSELSYHNEAIKISYLCNFIDRYILNAVGYRRFIREKELLKAILGYVNDCLHPILIKQLEV